MKKVLLGFAALMALMSLASCETKLCYCYEKGREVEMYVNEDTPCSSLNQRNRGCVERNERMDPNDVAYKNKTVR